MGVDAVLCCHPHGITPLTPMFRPLLAFLLTVTSSFAADHLALIGTYTGAGPADSRGIYAVRLDAATGALSRPELVAELSNPEFLALHPDGLTLYALTRVDTPERKGGGGVAALSLDRASGKLKLLNTEAAKGASLTHLAVDATGRMIVAASYSGGYVVTFPIVAGDEVGEPVGGIAQDGPLGPKHDRQDAPHPHNVTLSPDNRFAFIADLGIDRVFSYELHPGDAIIAANEAGAVTMEPGAGPRHTAFSPDGKFLYVLNELDGTVAVCRYDAAKGVATPFQRVGTSADDYTGRQSGSEIRVHPGGKFVYAANRGHNGIAVFARDEATGALTRVQVVSTGGKTPRNFNLSPDGAWLLCAHQDSGNLTVFRVDATTGKLTATPHTAEVPKGVCVFFVN